MSGTLAELQTDFLQAIFRNERTAIAAQVRAHGELTAEQRVGIYRNSVHANIGQYLASLYPVCQQLVGADFFEHLSDQYLDAAPPHTPFLADYGATLPVFMQDYPALAATRWIADMARLEWARHQAWNAIHQPAADFSQLATLSETEQADTCFELKASVQLVASAYALQPVWMAHQDEADPVKIPLEQITLRQDSQIIIWRNGRRLLQIELEPARWQFLRAVQAGNNLASLGEEFAEQLPTHLTHAIQRGWITGFSGV